MKTNRIIELEAALSFYASNDNWQERKIDLGGFSIHRSRIDSDQGDLAKQALENSLEPEQIDIWCGGLDDIILSQSTDPEEKETAAEIKRFLETMAGVE